jgi:hypothetical protein
MQKTKQGDEQLNFEFIEEKQKVTVVCWKWKPKNEYRTEFTGKHVNILYNMVMRNTTCDVDFVCVTDDPTGIDKNVRIIPIWPNPAPQYGARNKPNCFCRLKAFSPEIEKLFGKKFVWIDLDAVIVGNIDHILTDPAEFKIWRVDKESLPCNGSLVSHKTGTRKHIWETFNPKSIHPIHGLRKTLGYVGSDQSIIAKNLRKDDEFFTKEHGVYSYRCHILKMDNRQLPKNARIIFFHGEVKPDSSEAQHLAWVKRHYV